MRKVIVSQFMSLDGVVQSPMSPDEDADGGFRHGGWHADHMKDPASMDRMIRTITEAGGFLLGRKTYEIFAAYWPTAPRELTVVAEPLNTRPKFVASRSLAAPLAWQNSTLLGGNVAKAVESLKRGTGGPLVMFGSTKLSEMLMQHELVDELRLTIDPVLLGAGKRFFPDDGHCTAMDLIDSQVTSTGAVFATYAIRLEHVA